MADQTVQNATRSWDDLPVVLTTKQAASLLQVHENTVKNWAKSGRLPATKVGKAWRVPRDAVRAMIEGKATTGA